MDADVSLHWLDNLNQSLNMMVILIESCDTTMVCSFVVNGYSIDKVD